MLESERADGAGSGHGIPGLGAVKSPFRRGEDLNPVDSSFKGVRPDLVSMAAFFSHSGLVVCGPAPCVVGSFVPFGGGLLPGGGLLRFRVLIRA